MPVHPATISSLTKSVSIGVNGGKASVFNATPASPNCKASSAGTQCTFTVSAPAGLDAFVVTTYSAVNGAGTPLNRGTATFNIVKGKANAPQIRLGPVVSTTADTGMGSLRYALGSANPGDTVMFMIPSSSTIKIASPLQLNSNVSIAGPGVTRSSQTHLNRRHPALHSNVTFHGIEIDGQGAYQIFVVKGAVTSTISGLILTNGLATTTNQPGGAVYNEGVLTLASDALTDNDSQVDSPYLRIRQHAHHLRHKHLRRPHRAKTNGLRPHACVFYYGGAVYNHGNITISGSTFDSNVLETTESCSNTYGGAVYNDEYGTLTSSGNTYSHNAAYYGGAVYNDSTYGQASFTNDVFSANTGCTASTGCALTGCTGSGCTTYPYGDGAAIYDGDGPGVIVTNSTFSGNVVGGTATYSAGYGGAIDLETGSPSITGSTFINNIAGGGTSNCSYGYGGAIYEDANNTIELDKDIFTGNKAGGDDYGYGGAVYNDDQADSGSGNTFTSNQAYGTGSTCTATGEAAGGAVYADYGITMSGSTFKSNSASANYDAWGGAIYEGDPSNLSGDTFTSNGAVGSGANSATGSYAYGGAIYADGTLRLTGNTFASNGVSAKGTVGVEAYGGAVYMDGSSYSFTSNGNAFTSNTATIPSGTGSTYAYGGAMYADANIFVSNGDKYTSNALSAKTSVYGGALYVTGNNYGVTNNTFTSNKATATGGGAYGGAVSIDTGGTLASSTFTGNTASSTGAGDAYSAGGGAIEDGGGSTLNGLAVTGNKVIGGAGGGIYPDDTSAADTINNSVITGNTVSSTGDYGGGGGIYEYYDSNVNNTTIAGNTATINGKYAGGGGIYVDDVATITGSTISGNTVKGTAGAHSGGGGVFNYDDNTMANDTIYGNSTVGDGGGLNFYSQYNVYFNNVTVYQNTAAGHGGSIYNDNGASPYVSLANTIVAGGKAAGVANDVYNTGTMTSSDYNIFQTAATGGGSFTLMTHDKVADPKLLALSNNGGPTFTNADQSTSPGRAYIPFSGGNCGSVSNLLVDQRGFTRGAGGKCDVGAYELAGTPSLVKVHARAMPSNHRPNRTHLRRHAHRAPAPPHER